MLKANEPQKGYSKKDWDEVSDSPELTEADFAKARPAREVLPADFLELAAKRRARGPQKAPTKELVSLRLDRDVLTKFREQGRGWQVRINAALRKAAGLR
jgi:uncharacterized protein (DUF4415 family)